jgi:hypothetical protein
LSISNTSGRRWQSLNIRRRSSFTRKCANAQNSLGYVLEQRQLEIAISEFQAAIHIDSKLAAADYNLGFALKDTAISSGAGEERAFWRTRAEPSEGSKLAPV